MITTTSTTFKNGVAITKKKVEKMYPDGTKESVTESKVTNEEKESQKNFKEAVVKKLSGLSDADSGAHLENQNNDSSSDSSDDDFSDTLDRSSSSVSGEKVDKFAEKCLKEHNKLRAMHGVDPLKLNQKLCEYAQEWAENLAYNKIFAHRGDLKYGENIWTLWSSMPTKPNPKSAVQSWYNEIQKYDFNCEAMIPGTGHFTQVVWKSSKQLGVGVACKDGRTVVVTNYDPPGNYMGRYKENVFKPLTTDNEERTRC